MQEVISDAIFARIKGKSFKENCTTPREDLRYLRVKHYNNDGDVQEGELICHKDIAGVLLNVFYELYKAKYPIERMVLVDEYEADDDTLDAKATVAILPGKEIDVHLTIDDDGCNGYLKIPFVGKIKIKDAVRI